MPGYFIYEGLLVWTSLLIDTRTLEEGGRIDYSLSDKIGDLKALREGVAITGWSSGLVQPHLEQLSNVISSLENQQRTIMAPPASFFSEYVNMSPAPQPYGYQVAAYQSSYQSSEQYSAPLNSQGMNFSGDSQARIQEILQGATPSNNGYYENDACNPLNPQPSGAQVEPSALDMGQLPTAEYIDQFLASIGFSAPVADNPYTSSM